tara:strand:- start:3896 stop:4564 length:669 start_codon:yes stop_codon:yes gene_type:complete
MVKKNKTIETVKAICLLHNGDIDEFKLQKQLDVDKLDINKFPSQVLKVTGKDNLERECDFTYSDKTISVYAWTKGKAGTENKHELPPPIDKELYFGNIFIIYHNKGKLLNLSQSDYNEFYEMAFGGFEDIGSEDTWSTEEELDSDDSLNDFIVDDEDESDGDYDGSSENDPSLTSGSDTSVSEISLSSDSSHYSKKKNKVNKIKKMKKESKISEEKEDLSSD